MPGGADGGDNHVPIVQNRSGYTLHAGFDLLVVDGVSPLLRSVDLLDQRTETGYGIVGKSSHFGRIYNLPYLVVRASAKKGFSQRGTVQGPALSYKTVITDFILLCRLIYIDNLTVLLNCQEHHLPGLPGEFSQVDLCLCFQFETVQKSTAQFNEAEAQTIDRFTLFYVVPLPQNLEQTMDGTFRQIYLFTDLTQGKSAFEARQQFQDVEGAVDGLNAHTAGISLSDWCCTPPIIKRYSGKIIYRAGQPPSAAQLFQIFHGDLVHIGEGLILPHHAPDEGIGSGTDA